MAKRQRTRGTTAYCVISKEGRQRYTTCFRGKNAAKAMQRTMLKCYNQTSSLRKSKVSQLFIRSWPSVKKNFPKSCTIARNRRRK